MSHQIDAIYANGVFTPLTPLPLPEQARVKLTIDADEIVESPGIVAGQKEALRKLREDIDKLPQHKNNDGWSARDHDKLLYGSGRHGL